MNKYQYQVVRYVHDQVTGEFVNVGLILYSHEAKFLKAKFINKYSRISQFFMEVNGSYLLKLLKALERNINTADEDILSNDNLEQIIAQFLPKDDNSLQFSETKTGIIPPLKTDNKVFEHKLENLFSRLVSKYMEEKEERKDDSYVWKKLYKQYFDEYRITDKLEKHTVKTKQDEIEFDKSWKNGVWHCYQSLSFDLKNQENIKNKAYQWESILRELDTSDEQINVYLLTSLSKNKESNNFVMSKLKDIELNNVEVKFIEEKQAQELALSVKKAMEESEKSKQKI